MRYKRPKNCHDQPRCGGLCKDWYFWDTFRSFHIHKDEYSIHELKEHARVYNIWADIFCSSIQTLDAKPREDGRKKANF